MSAAEKIRQQATDPLENRAAKEGHRRILGPGEPALSEWAAAGLALPDLEGMRSWRLGRTRAQLSERGLAGALLFDPLNIFYAVDASNMQVWVLHNQARYVFVATDGPVVLFDYQGCEFLSGHNPYVDEVRSATPLTYFLAGDRVDEQTSRFADEIAVLVQDHGRGETRLAVDIIPGAGQHALEAVGLSLVDGMEVMEQARMVKGPDEIRAMRCSVEACRIACAEMFRAMRPGMTEQQLWAVLWAEMITRGGEWIECRLLDLIGSYGMMTDISRTWVCGNTDPGGQARHVHDLACEQLHRNIELLTPGRTFHQLTTQAWMPPVEDYRHYSCLFHGVGQCDEWPAIVPHHYWEGSGYDGVLEPGMVLTVESYVGARSGGPGVKLEDQVLITENGYENLSPWTLDLDVFEVL